MMIILVHTVSVRTKAGPGQRGGEGGGAIHMAGLVRQWVRMGHNVTIVTNSPGVFVASGASVISYERTRHVTDQGSPLGSAREVLRALRIPSHVRMELDALSVHAKDLVVLSGTSNISDILNAKRLARARRASVVVYFAHLAPPPWWFAGRRGGVPRSWAVWALGQAALALTKLRGLVPSVDQPRILSESGWVFRGPVLFDDAFLDRPPPEPATLQGTRPIEATFVSRLAPHKGLFDVPRIWALVVRQMPDARLLIAGDFESSAVERRFKSQLARERLNNSVTVEAHVSDSEKQEILAKSKIFLFPSYEEGWSLSVMEAATYGAVPVVYDLPAYDYLGPDLPKAPAGDLQEFAARAVAALSDTVLRERVASNLRKRALSYTVETVAKRQLEFLRSLSSDPTTDGP